MEALHVRYCSKDKPILMGRLVFAHRKFLFEYSPEFLEMGLELSPFKLPLKAGILKCEEPVFDGLFGIFNDSLPDGWGKLLLDRKLMGLGIHPDSITPLDRLRYVGTRGMGALQYEPEYVAPPTEKKEIVLDELAEECLHFQIHDEDQYVDDLLILNGSSAGARPKILVSLHSKTDDLELSDNKLTHTHEDWIIKFRSTLDPQDIGPIEFAYHLMAKEAGLVVPEAKLFKSKKGSGFFGVKRFDRTENRFLHAHTLSGLLHADYRIPSLDYSSVIKATWILTKNENDVQQQFRNAAFNVFAYNRDDHCKNFSFLMDGDGTWSVSPAYDLTFSAGPGGEHSTTVMGNGKNPGEGDLMHLAAVAAISEGKASEMIDQVKEAVLKWSRFAEEAGVSPKSRQWIQKQLSAKIVLK